jgi:hypothetical protein
MKITKQQIKQLIKEEINNLKEARPPMYFGDDENTAAPTSGHDQPLARIEKAIARIEQALMRIEKA